MSGIAFVLKGYPRVSETFIAQEIFLLEQRGFKIEIISLRGPREKERQPIVDKIRARVTYLPETITSQLDEVALATLLVMARRPARFFSSLGHAVASALRHRTRDPLKRLVQVCWLMVKRDPARNGVIHFHSHFLHDPTELTFYLHRMTGLPYTISAHAKDVYTIPKAQVSERVRNARFLMTCTGFNVEYIRSIPEVDGSKVYQVYHGIDLETFIPSKEPAVRADEALRLVSIGRIVEKKGYEHILQALRLLKDEGLDFVYDIYGTGDWDKPIKQLATALSLDDRVRFHGAKTQPVLIRRLEEKGIFVCGSQNTGNGDRDGIPNTVAEAMAMELPIVATRVSGIPELVEDGKQGLLVEEKNPRALAQAIRRLARDPELADRMGKAGRARVAEMFNSHRCIDVCERLLRPMVQA